MSFLWKIKEVVSSTTSESSSSEGRGEMHKYSVYACGIACILLFCLGLLDIIFNTIIIGIICLVVTPPVMILELKVYEMIPFPESCWSTLNFLNDFRSRAVLYIVLSIPCLFSLYTFIGALALAGCGGFQVFLWFKGERLPDMGSKDNSSHQRFHDEQELPTMSK